MSIRQAAFIDQRLGEVEKCAAAFDVRQPALAQDGDLPLDRGRLPAVPDGEQMPRLLGPRPQRLGVGLAQLCGPRIGDVGRDLGCAGPQSVPGCRALQGYSGCFEQVRQIRRVRPQPRGRNLERRPCLPVPASLVMHRTEQGQQLGRILRGRSFRTAEELPGLHAEIGGFTRPAGFCKGADDFCRVRKDGSRWLSGRIGRERQHGAGCPRGTCALPALQGGNPQVTAYRRKNGGVCVGGKGIGNGGLECVERLGLPAECPKATTHTVQSRGPLDKIGGGRRKIGAIVRQSLGVRAATEQFVGKTEGGLGIRFERPPRDAAVENASDENVAGAGGGAKHQRIGDVQEERRPLARI